MATRDSIDYEKELATPECQKHGSYENNLETLMKSAGVESGEYNVDTVSPSALELDYQQARSCSRNKSRTVSEACQKQLDGMSSTAVVYPEGSLVREESCHE